MQNSDPKGYYSILQVSESADEAEIKAAYKRRAMELHPDRNPSPSATALFQKLNEANAILSNPALRAQYDTATIEIKSSDTGQDRNPIEPITCSCCGKISAQPRYVIFSVVKSYFVLTTKSAVQGIFCYACAEKKAIKASLTTWILGWWGVPWGPIYSVQALLVNTLGGNRPNDVNARVLAHQSMYFASIGKFEIAGAIADECLTLIQKTSPNISDMGSIKTQIEKLKSICGKTNSKLKNPWGIIRKLLIPHLAISLFLAGWITFELYTPTKPSSARSTYHSTDKYIRPSTAPNGSPWPIAAGYIPHYPILNTTGLSSVTIDNRQNDADVFVKLIDLDVPSHPVVRTMFIAAFGSFTMSSVSAGRYDVRYRDLKTGGLSGSEPFTLEEVKTYNGTQYSDISITLYTVRNGNMKTRRLLESEF